VPYLGSVHLDVILSSPSGTGSPTPQSHRSAGVQDVGRVWGPAIMIAMPTAEIYTLLLAGLLVAGVLWVVTRFIDRD
jgi:hypothetical protein